MKKYISLIFLVFLSIWAKGTYNNLMATFPFREASKHVGGKDGPEASIKLARSICNELNTSTCECALSEIYKTKTHIDRTIYTYWGDKYNIITIDYANHWSVRRGLALLNISEGDADVIYKSMQDKAANIIDQCKKEQN